MSLTVTLYTKPECVQCVQTKKLMEKEGIPFTSVDVSEDAEALDYIKNQLNYLGAPVVQWEAGGVVGGHWSGFRPDQVRELKVYVRDESVTSSLVGVNGG
jgi:glutaredoxin-like protein NrdH